MGIGADLVDDYLDHYFPEVYAERVYDKQQLNIMKSKIKEIVEINSYENSYGITYYHNLIMENGDMINIGKKKEQQVGWELDYEITDDQQEFNKAKGIPLEQGATETSEESVKPPYKQVTDDERQTLIIRQSSLTRAQEFYADGKDVMYSPEDVMKLAEKYENWVKR